MRTFLLTIFVVTLGIFAGSASASEGIDAVLKMQQSGASQSVLMTYVQTANVAYDPTADEIQQLEDAKVPATVIVAMLERGAQLKAAPAQPVPSVNASLTVPVAPAADAGGADIVAPEPEDQNISYFYEAMAPYGEWVTITPDTWVWRPTGTEFEANWRPYAQGGHWTWTDVGWYWESTYRWGWAPFHYGRWSYDDRYHWVWTPDTTWGPSWVAWRTSDQFYGWAPLPPGVNFEADVGLSFHHNRVGVDFDFGLSERDFAFVPVAAFLDVDLGGHLVPRDEHAAVFRQTTLIRNSFESRGGTIINKGMSTDSVALHTGRKIETVRVVDSSAAPGQPIKSGIRSGDTLTAFRPKLAAKAPVDPPTMIKRLREHAPIGRRDEAAKPPANTVNPELTHPVAPLSENDAKRRLLEEKIARRGAQQKRSRTIR